MPILLLFVLFAGTVLFPKPVAAYSCSEQGSLAEGVASAEAVFSGHILRTSRTVFGNYAIVEVDHAWKGISQKYVYIKTGLGGGDCGVNFVQSEEKKVYFSTYPQSCGPFFSIDLVKAQLGEGVTNLTDNWYLKFLPPFWQHIGIVAVLILITLAVFGLRRMLKRKLVPNNPPQ